MFRNKFQAGIMPIFCGSGLNPLSIWAKHGKGCLKRVTDEESQALVLEIIAIQFCTTYIALPANPKTVLGIRLPHLNILVKYMKLPFCFEFEVMDSSMMKRRFRCSNCQSSTTINPLLCHTPLALDSGWNNIHVHLPSFTRQTYHTDYVEFLGIQIFANCRLRLVYFSDRWYKDEELPNSFRLWKSTKRSGSRLSRPGP